MWILSNFNFTFITAVFTGSILDSFPANVCMCLTYYCISLANLTGIKIFFIFKSGKED